MTRLISRSLAGSITPVGIAANVLVRSVSGVLGLAGALVSLFISGVEAIIRPRATPTSRMPRASAAATSPTATAVLISAIESDVEPVALVASSTEGSPSATVT
jgi:hypothetical protein